MARSNPHFGRVGECVVQCSCVAQIFLPRSKPRRCQPVTARHDGGTMQITGYKNYSNPIKKWKIYQNELYEQKKVISALLHLLKI